MLILVKIFLKIVCVLCYIWLKKKIKVKYKWLKVNYLCELFLKILLDFKVVWLNLKILFNWVLCVYFLMVVGLLNVMLFNLFL